jgi:hypothetical protein
MYKIIIKKGELLRQIYLEIMKRYVILNLGTFGFIFRKKIKNSNASSVEDFCN